MNRRSVLAGIAAVPVMPGFSRDDDPGLQVLAGRAGMLFGAAVSGRTLTDDASLRAAIARECGQIVPEVELKWGWIEPKPGMLSFTAADTIAAFAATHGKRLHGHTLVWHQSVPDWASSRLAATGGWDLVERYMATVIGRYAQIETWDVVNEVLSPEPAGEPLRQSPFLTAFGADYIARAFTTAHRLAPRATLFLNEYDLAYDLPATRAKRRALLELLDTLLEAGVPIGGVGLQAHLDCAKQDDLDEPTLAAFLNEIGARGLQIRISELDVREADRSLPLAQRDRRVADMAARYLDVALDNRAVGTVACWGLSDRHSWLNTADGTVNRGLPLDFAYAAKPLRAVIAAALERRSDEISTKTKPG